MRKRDSEVPTRVQGGGAQHKGRAPGDKKAGDAQEEAGQATPSPGNSPGGRGPCHTGLRGGAALHLRVFF